MEIKKITEEMKAKLDAPLPAEAVRPHPSKSYLSTINAIYVTERLNDVFGVGAWRTKTEFVTSQPTGKATMVVTKTIFEIPEYGIYYECYGGNDNADLGDAYKGSMTDALTKIGSYLGIGADVWKDKSNKQQTTQQRQQPASAPQPKPQPTPEQRRQNAIAWLTKQPEAVIQDAMAKHNVIDLNLVTLGVATKLYNYIQSIYNQNK